MFHVSFASVPILVPWAVYQYYPQPGRVWHPHPAEFLFFTFMISSIACGEVAEWMYRDRFRKPRALLLASFALGAVWSVILYAISVHQNIETGKMDSDPKLLLHSMILAGAFLTLGTLVEWRLDDLSKTWRPSS